MHVCMTQDNRTCDTQYTAMVQPRCNSIHTSEAMFMGARPFFEWFHLKVNMIRVINTWGLPVTCHNSPLLGIYIAMMRLLVCMCNLTSPNAITVTRVRTLDKGKGSWSSNHSYEHLCKGMLHEDAFKWYGMCTQFGLKPIILFFLSLKRMVHDRVYPFTGLDY